MTEDQKNMIDMVTALIVELEAEQKRHEKRNSYMRFCSSFNYINDFVN